MLIGFVLLLASSTVELMPISERIYPNKASCELIKKKLLERRPTVHLEYAEVFN
ncbi:hypothetical protein [Pantoea endophytica]|uniref:hypothetical protein n=1 Tax=Pantoea endophytica TaxID=92488 RepID=UPI00289A88DA|nr:hypothetical protein [Pantoea endophytica]